MSFSIQVVARNMVLPSLIIVASLYSGLVSAHTKLLLISETPPRYDSVNLKGTDVCGEVGRVTGPPTNIKSIFTQGQTINVEWVETVRHTGSFYIDFASSINLNTSTNNDFSTPKVIFDPNTALPIGGQKFATTFPLNYPPCENCILRLRQDMSNPLDYSNGLIYHSCADIAIVDPLDTVAPGLLVVTIPTTTDTAISLDWSNATPIDISEILITRILGGVANNATPSDMTHYNVGDAIGTATIIAKLNANTSSYDDVGLTPEQAYTYKVFARDSNYNYNTGTVAVVTTLATSAGNPGPTPPPSTDVTSNPKPNSSSGAGFGILTILLGLFLSRKYFPK